MNANGTSVLSIYPGAIDTQLKTKEIGIALTNYKFLLLLIKETVSSILQGMTPDPVVGENSCQFRASWLVDVLNSPEIGGELIGCLNALLPIEAKVSGIIHQIETLKPALKTPSLKQYLNEQNLELVTSETVQLLALAHFLTITKTTYDELRVDEDGALRLHSTENTVEKRADLASRHKVTVSFLKQLDIKGRSILKETSLTLAKQCVLTLPDTLRARLTPMLEEANTHLHGPVYTAVPCVAGMEVIFQSALQKGTPLVLKVDCIDKKERISKGQIEILYMKDALTQTYKEERHWWNHRNKAAIILGAVSIDEIETQETLEATREKILSLDIIDIILAGAAAHPQYPQEDKELLPPLEGEENKARREAYTRLALEQGLCGINPKTCRVYHIEAGIVKNHLRGSNPFLALEE